MIVLRQMWFVCFTFCGCLYWGIIGIVCEGSFVRNSVFIYLFIWLWYYKGLHEVCVDLYIALLIVI